MIAAIDEEENGAGISGLWFFGRASLSEMN
jgi:hypothetical protein